MPANIYRRHLKSCEHRGEGRAYHGCQCPVWVDGVLAGIKVRESLKTQDWQKATAKIAEWEARGAKEAPTPRELLTDQQAQTRFAEYITVEKGLSPLTIAAYKADLAQLAQFLSGQQLVTAGRREIGDFVLKLLCELRPRSVRRKISTYREFFRFLLLDHAIKADPMAAIESVKVGRLLPKTLTASEMTTALEGELHTHRNNACAERTRPRDCALLELLYAGGLRASEATGARLVDLKLADRYITVRGKGNKERIVPLGVPAQQALQQYLAHRQNNSPWLFPGRRGQKLTRERVWQIVHKVFGQIGRSVSPHMLRHACATGMMERGANLRVVQEVLGHADISTTEIYTHVTVDQRKKVYLQCHPRATRGMQLNLFEERASYAADQFRNLVASPSAGHDSNRTGSKDEHDTAASLRSGDRTTPDDQNSAASFASASGQTGLPAGDRRRPPKRVSSAAQKRVAEARRLMWSNRASKNRG